MAILPSLPTSVTTTAGSSKVFELVTVGLLTSWFREELIATEALHVGQLILRLHGCIRALLVDLGSTDDKTFLSWAKRMAMTVAPQVDPITFKNNRRNKIKIKNYGSGIDKYPI